MYDIFLENCSLTLTNLSVNKFLEYSYNHPNDFSSNIGYQLIKNLLKQDEQITQLMFERFHQENQIQQQQHQNQFATYPGQRRNSVYFNSNDQNLLYEMPYSEPYQTQNIHPLQSFSDCEYNQQFESFNPHLSHPVQPTQHHQHHLSSNQLINPQINTVQQNSNENILGYINNNNNLTSNNNNMNYLDLISTDSGAANCTDNEYLTPTNDMKIDYEHTMKSTSEFTNDLEYEQQSKEASLISNNISTSLHLNRDGSINNINNDSTIIHTPILSSKKNSMPARITRNTRSTAATKQTYSKKASKKISKNQQQIQSFNSKQKKKFQQKNQKNKLTNKAYRNIKQYFGRALLNFIKFKKKQLVIRCKEHPDSHQDQMENSRILSITPLLMWLNDLNYKNQMKTTQNWLDALQHHSYGSLLTKYAKVFFKRNINLQCACEDYINIGKSQYKQEFIDKIDDFFKLVCFYKTD